MKTYKILFVVLSLFLVHCSDQPSQRPNKDQIIQNPDSPSTPILKPSEGDVGGLGLNNKSAVYIVDNVIGRQPTEIRDPRVDGENIEDDKIEENGKKPILFSGVNPRKSGVAGIDFGMSYDEASEVLSQPYVGACGSLGDYYLENMCLLWSDEEPRRLRQVYMLDGYLGTFDFPEPIGTVPMKAELSKVFTEDMGPRGEEILKRTYNNFFKKEEAYNCLEEKVCQAVFYNDYINWIMPNLTVIFSKDRKVFIGLIINQDVAPGDFASPIDLVTGEIFAPQKTLALGDSWDAVLESISLQGSAPPPSILEATAYRKDFVGVVTRIDRAGVYENSENFDVNALEPQGSEPFTNYFVYANYNEAIKLNGKYVKVDYIANSDAVIDVNLSLVDEKPAQENILNVRMPSLAENVEVQKNFIQKLGLLITDAFNEKYPNSVITQRIAGLNARQAPNRSYVIRTSHFDFASGRNSFVYVNLGYNTGNMSFGMSLDRSPLGQRIMKTMDKPVQAAGQDLAGYRLGQSVKITDIDRTKGEGFLEIDGERVRVSVALFSSVYTSFENGVTRHQKVAFVEGLGGASLGVYSNVEINQETTAIEGEIIYISSSLNPLGVEGLCGMEETFATGLTQQTFHKQLLNAVKNFKSPCTTFVAHDKAGDGQANTYYFPEQGIKVYFSERVLVGVAKYRKPGQFDLSSGGAE